MNEFRSEFELITINKAWTKMTMWSNTYGLACAIDIYYVHARFILLENFEGRKSSRRAGISRISSFFY